MQPYVKWNSDINMRRCKMVDDCQHLCNPAICVSRLCLSERRRTSLFSLLISAGESHEYTAGRIELITSPAFSSSVKILHP